MILERSMVLKILPNIQTIYRNKEITDEDKNTLVGQIQNTIDQDSSGLMEEFKRLRNKTVLTRQFATDCIDILLGNDRTQEG